MEFFTFRILNMLIRYKLCQAVKLFSLSQNELFNNYPYVTIFVVSFTYRDFSIIGKKAVMFLKVSYLNDDGW